MREKIFSADALINIALRFWDRHGLLLRYCISGGTGAILQVGTLAFWVEVIHHGDETDYRSGVVLGFVIALIVTFLLQKYWTFSARTGGYAHRQFVLYTTFALVNLGGTAFFMYLLVEKVHVWYIAANILVVGVIAFLNFLANRHITFRVQLDNFSVQ